MFAEEGPSPTTGTNSGYGRSKELGGGGGTRPFFPAIAREVSLILWANQAA